MATRKATRPGPQARKPSQRQTQDRTARQVSAIVGGVLVGVAALWFIWLFARQVNPSLSVFTFPLPGVLTNNTSTQSTEVLAAAGITLSSPSQNQPPLVAQQQALLLANQLQPQVAASAGGVNEEYTLVSYTSTNPSVPSLRDVAAWMVHYSQVKEPGADTGADPHASTTHHDFYIFLDAKSGEELLAIWL